MPRDVIDLANELCATKQDRDRARALEAQAVVTLVRETS